MEIGEKKISRGYDKAPWIFRGSALYQLHLVKADVARALIPKGFRLVEAFGYTLGGFFLASYEDSPAGIFDELVVIAGTVWNPPTSCAWAAKVFVNSDEACHHGRTSVGLPSQVARFSKRLTPAQQKPPKGENWFLSILGLRSSRLPDQMEVSVCDVDNPTAAQSFNIDLVTPVAAEGDSKWRGPQWPDRLQSQPLEILMPDRMQGPSSQSSKSNKTLSKHGRDQT
ncbi:hypothetical protein SAY86_026420 [Trapa natans]|uniref:Protein NEOXANTHIN-DEFICIENT 1 n=1 Tax=Trapa natans TaxID=22666 RepID=A0AAN7KDT3_TRANT|nr:hypothetical protein SAY86_026420 [Trapa natans]